MPVRARPVVVRLIDALDAVARGGWRAVRGGPPLPPWSLRRRVGSRTIGVHVSVGRRAAADIQRVLASAGRPLQEGDRVLDWGCGSGRIGLQLMQRRPEVDFHGCDVDGDAISWLRRAVPDGDRRFQVSGFSPPLPYAEDSFDVVYAISVFTHICEADQLAWLRELARVLAPDGTALLTTQGPYALEHVYWSGMPSYTAERLSPQLGRLDELGFIFASYSADLGRHPEKYPGISGDYGLAYQSEQWTRERWSEVFEIRQILPLAIGGYQDTVLATQRPTAAQPGA